MAHPSAWVRVIDTDAAPKAYRTLSFIFDQSI